MNPICVSCKKEMSCTKNGVVVSGEVEHWCLSGDQYICKSCGSETIIFDQNAKGFESTSNLQLNKT